MLNALIYLAALIAALLGGNTQAEDEIGQPCDPETYSGPYRCVADGDGFYSIAK